MSERIKIGVVGAGKMSGTMCRTLAKLNSVELYAVASRSEEKAKEFALAYGFEKYYGGYDKLIADGEVGLVYVATPHSHHFGHVAACIDGGKPVLCEKAFTVNAREAKEIKRLSEESGVFVAEAIWTRYMPSRKAINDLLASGVIGRPMKLEASLCYPISEVERIYDSKLGGGVLLDLGVYGLNFALMHFGKDFCKVEAEAEKNGTGADLSTDIRLFYPDGRVATLHHDAFSTKTEGVVTGTEGVVTVDNINCPHRVTATDLSGKIVKEITFDMISGYEYEIEECVRLIREGKTESESMPLGESVFVMETIDKIKNLCGIRFPADSRYAESQPF